MTVGEHIVAWGACLALALTGCISGTRAVVADVSPEGWRAPVELRYLNDDSLAARRFRLALRHSAEADSVTGRYLVEAISPSGIPARDTLTVSILFDAQRNRLGEARSSASEIEIAGAGEWLFAVTPLRPVPGVWSIGLEFE